MSHFTPSCLYDPECSYIIEDIEPTIALTDHFNYTDYLADDEVCYYPPTLTTEYGYETEKGAITYSTVVCQSTHYEEDTKVINITDSREKKRLSNINGAFERLKEVIPTFPFEKRLTKIETLKLAISYIGMLRDIMKSNQTPDDFIALVLKGDTRAATWYSQESKFFLENRVYSGDGTGLGPDPYPSPDKVLPGILHPGR